MSNPTRSHGGHLEHALRASEERYRQLVEHASDIIYNCDLDGRFTFCNPVTERVMQYRQEELIGRHFLTLIRADYRQTAASFYALQLEKGTPSTYFEFPAIARNGTEVWFGQNVQLVKADGRVIGVQAIARDITAQRGLEEQLRQAQKMEAIGRLAGGVAHDFNNLLTAILGSAELLSLQLPADDPLRLEADAIAQAAIRGAGITRRLLDFSRPTSGTETHIDANGLIAGMHDMLRRVVVGHVVLTIDASSQETLVCAESGLLEQVVLNLVMNARDASTAGSGVTIQTTRVALDHLQAMSLGVREGQYWVLSVTDHGEGMDSDTLSHAFEPFFTTKDPTRGTGLGLSIVYTIVTRLQGGIKVTSDRGKGSTFSIYLPRVSSTGAVATE